MAENNNHMTDTIMIKVLGFDNAVTQFLIGQHTPLRRVIRAYCRRCGIDRRAVRFLFDGHPIDRVSTPCSLLMENGDTIDIFQRQDGGFC